MEVFVQCCGDGATLPLWKSLISSAPEVRFIRVSVCRCASGEKRLAASNTVCPCGMSDGD